MDKPLPVKQFLPHDDPLVLIDDLVDVDTLSVHCRVAITDQHYFFEQASRSVAGYVGIEFMAQSIAAWSGYHASLSGGEPPVGFLLGTRRYQIEASRFQEGQVLDIYAEQIMESNGMSTFSGRIECDGQTLAVSQLNVFVPSQEKLEQLLNRKSS